MKLIILKLNKTILKNHYQLIRRKESETKSILDQINNRTSHVNSRVYFKMEAERHNHSIKGLNRIQ